jgi:2-aminophenol/2-amino-5-chlorophenol 1,6-dioxygenase subunit beta
MSEGRIVAGCLSPHPPHLVYAANPQANEPQASGSGAWKPLADGYTTLKARLSDLDYDVVIVHTPHWKTTIGHHFLGVPHFDGFSVDPVFPNLFRFKYELDIDVELAELLAAEASDRGLVTSMMRNPDFRVDYGTLTCCQLALPNPFEKPMVVLSSSNPYHYFSNDVGDREMLALGHATRAAVAKSGRKALLLASTSMSHRHFTEEPDDPEDPRFEYIYNNNQLAWDKRMLTLMKSGRCAQILAEMPDFIQQSVSECKEGGFTWLLGALDVPDYPALVHGYGSVIGTGNAIVEWRPQP